ncbi:MAG: hypothetical protein P4M09_24995 [Devosia sp.]|nr:hypothetical protein [Devosia sp.]
MAKRITLHIGAPKTGTSHLQEWLDRNRAVLAEAGLWAMPLEQAYVFSAHNVQEQFVARPDVAGLASCDRQTLLSTIAELPQDRIVISSEYFSISYPHRVAAMCEEIGASVEAIILFVRRQDRLVGSGYAQDVKALGQAVKLEGFAYYPEIDWMETRHRWSSIFPSATLRLHNYDFHAADLLRTFKRDLGVSQIETDDTRSIDNPSLNALTTEMARMQNARGAPVEVDRLLRLQQLIPGPPFSIRPALARQIEELYIYTNKAFAHDLDYIEFGSLTMPCWQGNGVDMTGAVSEAQLEFLLSLVPPEPLPMDDPTDEAPASAELSAAK